MDKKIDNLLFWLNEKNIENVEVIDLRQISTEIDYMIIGTAISVRHAQTLSDYIDEKAKDEEYILLSKEGRDSGNWILMDYGDVLVNIFTEEERSRYNLEKLWADGKFILNRDKNNSDS